MVFLFKIKSFYDVPIVSLIPKILLNRNTERSGGFEFFVTHFNQMNVKCEAPLIVVHCVALGVFFFMQFNVMSFVTKKTDCVCANTLQKHT